MESNKILQADILDILFEDRNKEYGAYELRKTYNRRLAKAIAVTGSVIVLVFVGGIVMGRGAKKMVVAAPPPDLVLVDVNDKQPPPPPTPPPPPQPRPQVRQVALTPPKIEPDDKVRPDEKPPTVDDIDNAKIGAHNIQGTDDVGITAPPSSDGIGKGVVEAPKKDDEPEIWTKVEIESSYPGGPQAWLRFLNKNLRYPDDAQNNGISGVVMVQFIVDEQGNVSDVKAVSGPEQGGLREEAVRAIKKSGLWVPAIQNGRKVKSYKRQPFTFKMPEE